MAAVASAGPGAGVVALRPEHDIIFISCNELAQEVTQKIFATLALRGNGIFGCSGTYILNLASLVDGITDICPYDISEKVERLWEGFSKIIPTLNPVNLEESQARFCAWIGEEYPEDRVHVQADIKANLSFLSTAERLARICKIFRTKPPTFTRIDAGDKVRFKEFLDQKASKGITPHAFYVSNMATSPGGANFHLMDGDRVSHSRYKDFAESYGLIPATAIVIDAVLKPGNMYASQRIHIKPLRNGLLPVPCPCAFRTALNNDHYDDIRFYISHGSNANEVDRSGYTHLMTAAEYGRLNSMRSLLDSRVDVNSTGSGQNRDSTALHMAANAGQSDAIELLLSRNANIDALGEQQMTPLHHAAAQGHLGAVRTLLECGANRFAFDSAGYTPLALTQMRNAPVYKLCNTDSYKTLQGLLKSGCPRRAPRPLAPAVGSGAAAAASAGPGGPAVARVEDKKGA